MRAKKEKKKKLSKVRDNGTAFATWCVKNGITQWQMKTVQVFYGTAMGLKPGTLQWLRDHSGNDEKVNIRFF